MNSHDSRHLAEREAGSQTPALPFAPSSQQDWSHSQPQFLSSASSYAELQYLFSVQDPTMNVPKPNRNRRKSNQGSDHTKHRRTRSGCYTCRSRRVKCDENHPTCERCKKGGRDCVYPETATSTKPSTSGSSNAEAATAHDSASSSSDEGENEGSPGHLEAILDEDEGDDEHASFSSKHQTAQSASGQQSAARVGSETPSLVLDKGASPTPSTEGSVGYPHYHPSGVSRQKKSTTISKSGDNLNNKWSRLPVDVQFYLTYFCENLTYLHYSLKYDSGNFLKTTFLDAALGNEALLYAIVGFSAFQRTLHTTGGNIQDFLQYYNKSVSLLLNSLKRGEKRTKGTILAILQLATIEEFLGDWINLLGHQKAAYEILTELYTPQTVMAEPMTRVILGWYMRFDVFAGLMGGFETVLSRQWFSYSYEFFQHQAATELENLDWKIETAIAQYRLLATDMSLLFAKMGKGAVSHERFLVENDMIRKRIEEWQTKMDPALQDSRYLVTDFPNRRPFESDDIVDPYLPGILYSGPLWVMNGATLDWISIDLMHRYQTALTTQTQPSAELGIMAYRTCQLFEACEYYPGSPPGTVLALQASLGIASLFLPKDEKHSMWARRKLATIESHGYIYPYTFRTKMADLFGDRSCMHWWLPNDENYPPIIRSIRKFVEERTSTAKTMPAEDLRDMKAIFATMKINDETSNSARDQGKGLPTGVTVAQSHEPLQDIGSLGHDDSDPYALKVDDEQGFWGEGQSGGSYGLSKPPGY